MRTAPSASEATALASATRSWLARETFWMRRLPTTIGRTASGMPTSAHAASFGLVTNSIASAPTTVTTLRNATDMLEPTTLRSSSASAVSREISSPLRVRSKKPASSPSRCA